ncbi:hypothetical protein ACOZ7A_000035 [Yersinia enterocolitica]|uniref:DUF4760 domain-containing protein n=1 Tax=Yersinia hibernica TaxID=2339259 RepID=A0ABX5QZC1_9GAMM|nr:MULTISPECIES: hypothetical protein [Yersinia]ELI8480646.1 hypothetical protein [Yersinia enterocolitica]MDA5534501.1 hypothetical protein [Yersinia mollaretii]NIL02422.1 hypothetical protein [Yersinia mollaretii]QAX78361.1 hypothetical protein D5F51_07185 [Yersinia hibernica]CRX45664.1 Uncharacterised protein [Yersinia enterocolitica]
MTTSEWIALAGTVGTWGAAAATLFAALMAMRALNAWKNQEIYSLVKSYKTAVIRYRNTLKNMPLQFEGYVIHDEKFINFELAFDHVYECFALINEGDLKIEIQKKFLPFYETHLNYIKRSKSRDDVFLSIKDILIMNVD